MDRPAAGTSRGRVKLTPARGAILAFLATFLLGILWSATTEQKAVTAFTRSFEARFIAEIDRRKAVLDGFTASAGRLAADDPALRVLAADHAILAGGWFVIVRPGPDVVIDFTTLGDGSTPTVIPRASESYAAIYRAERVATATNSAALTDVFIGRKSGLPSVSLVREAVIGSQLRYVFLSHAAESFASILDADLPEGMHVALRDSTRHIVNEAVEPYSDIAVHGAWDLSAPLRVSAVRDLPFGWSVYAHRHWLRTSVLVFPALLAGMLALMVHTMLRLAARQQPVAATEPLRDRLSFVLTLGHELRSPLISLLSAIDAVKRGSDLGSEAFLDHATREAHSLLRLIDDVLDCAKLTQADIVVHEEPYSPSDLARACAETVQPTVYPGVEVDVSAEGLPNALIGDRSKIRQVILNFLTNAAKFTLQGQIRLQLSSRETGDGGADVLFVVSDTGEGMDKETLSQLFHATGVLEGRSLRNPKGNGLGLVTARLLAEAMGGTVGADSTPGQGSRFWLRLPQRVAPVAPKAKESDIAGLVGLRILAAEDDPILGRVLAEDLTACGAEVTLVTDGQQLVDVCLAGQFDIILTDLRMPRLSGYEAVARIKAAHPDPAPLIFAISAHFAASPFERDGQSLFDGALPKPFAVKAFIARLDEIEGARKQEAEDEHDLSQMDALLRAYGARAGTLTEDICETLVSGYDDCKTAPELARIGAICHRLSGVALTIGMKDLGLRLLEIETTCESGDRTAVEAALAELGPVILRSCALLRERAAKARREVTA